MSYPQDETDLTSDQMDRVMMNGESVELVTPIHMTASEMNSGIAIRVSTWGAIQQQSEGDDVVRVEQPA